MKQKNPQKLATSQELSRVEVGLKQEFSGLREEFGSLREEFGGLKEDVGRLKQDVGSLREEGKQYRDEVLSKLDDISGQLGNLREENIIGSHQTSQLRQDVDSHEKRIKNLEKIQHVS
jgi:chromosome segregation ATPase